MAAVRRGFFAVTVVVASLVVVGAMTPAKASAANAQQTQYLRASAKTDTNASLLYASMQGTPVLSFVLTHRAEALSATYDRFAATLSHMHWHGSAARAVRSFEKYVRSFAGFLLTIHYQTQASMTSWTEQVSVIGNAGSAPLNTLRRDLGIGTGSSSPPATPTTVPPPTTVPTTSTTTTTVPPPTTTTTTTSPPPPPAPTPAPAPRSCTPIDDEGGCYEPGEYCRDDDHGMTGVAGDGETITCEDNDGWRWEPT